MVRAGTAGLEVWFLSRSRESARRVMGHGFPRYRDRTCLSPKGSPPREINRVVPRINDSSLEPKGSGDFLYLFSCIPHCRGGASTRPPCATTTRPSQKDQSKTTTSLRGGQSPTHPRVASLAPSGQFTFWQSPAGMWGIATPLRARNDVAF